MKMGDKRNNLRNLRKHTVKECIMHRERGLADRTHLLHELSLHVLQLPYVEDHKRARCGGGRKRRRERGERI